MHELRPRPVHAVISYAVEDAKLFPFTQGEVVEIRKAFEPEDFEPVVKTKAGKKVIADEKKFYKKQKKS